ncbi:hypothetical protein [Streptomyces sp. NPDC048172]|uniref:hypothetical protein n=1 Tax=Streptomyces sp. NPDC048172 TaxID=3365505 RepID=UPI00371C664F
MAEIASWYETAEPLLIISAEPGVGKSALAVRLAQISLGEAPPPQGIGPGWLHAWHFCQAQRFGSLNIRGVLEGVADQLRATLPGYAEAVACNAPTTTIAINQEFTGPVQNSNVIGVNRLVLPDVEPLRLLDNLLRQPLSELGTQTVILLDAVDETEEQADGQQTLARLLSMLRTEPVPGLRLVLTTRNGPTAERFSHGRQLRLQHDEPAGTHDVLAYLQGRLHDRGVTDPTRVAQSIAHFADGNFLFATLAASEDAEWLRLLVSGERALPRGLADLYSSFLDRQVTADPRRWREVIRPVLGLLVQSRGDGFTRRQLAQLSGLRQSAVDDALELCAPYLRGPRPDGPFLPFHGSLRDHLRSEFRHGIYPRESIERIISTFRTDATNPHGVENLLGYMADRAHLAGLGTGNEGTPGHDRGNPRELRELGEAVTDCGYLSARIQATGVDSLLDEIAALRDSFPRFPVLGSVHGILGRQAHNLRIGAPGGMTSFATQQLLYECSVSGNSGLLRHSRGPERSPVFAALWSAGSENSRLLSHTLATSEFFVDALAMSQDGTRTALCVHTWRRNDKSTTVKVFDTETGSTIREFSLSENGLKVRSLRFSDDGRRLLALRVDQTSMAWDLSSGTREPVLPDEIRELQPASQSSELPPYAIPGQVPPDLDELVVAITPDRRYAAIGKGHGNTVTMWDLANRTTLGRYDAHRINHLAISPDGRWVVVGSAIGGAHVLSPLSPSSQFSRDGHLGAVRTASLHDGHAATLGHDGDLKIWNAATGQLVRTRGTPSVLGGADTLAVDDEASLCVVGNHDGSATLLDLQRPSFMRPLMVGGAPCDENWRTRDGAQDEALPPVGAGDCPRTEWPTRVNDRHGSPVSALDIAPDGRRIATGTLNGVVRVWDANTGDLVREVTRAGHLVRSVRFTPDGSHVITVAQLGGPFLHQWEAVEVWSLSSGELTRTLWPDAAHPRFTLPAEDTVAALTRNGRYLATGHQRGTVTVHNLATGQEFGHLALHGAITCLAFDESRLLAGTANGDVTLTDVRGMPASAHP